MAAARTAGILAGMLLATATAAAASDWHKLCAAELDAAGLQACEAAVAAAAGTAEALPARRQLAWAFLRNGEEPRAIALFDELALLRPDDPQAQFDSAAAHATIWNYPTAAGYITAAVRHGRRDAAAYLLGAIIFEQLARPAEAFVFHHRLARLGETTGMFDLAQDFADGRGTAADSAAAVRWYERAADDGHVGAMLTLAEAYRKGDLDLEPDADLAARWQARAAAARGAVAAE